MPSCIKIRYFILEALYEGFIYAKQKNLANQVTPYECELRRNACECKAKLHVKNEEVVKQIDDHTHATNIGRPEVLKIYQSVICCTINNMETTQQIISQEIGNVSAAAATQLPAIRSIGRNIRHIRQTFGNPSSIPINFMVWEINKESSSSQLIEIWKFWRGLKICFLIVHSKFSHQYSSTLSTPDFHALSNVFMIPCVTIQQSGLQIEYVENFDFSLKVRMLTGFAFIPPGEVIEAFEILYNVMTEISIPVVDYFKDAYIGPLQLHGHTSETELIVVCLVHITTLEDGTCIF
ncbi:unnamed protein product [Lepeophtheirus salmonis]|uniref:(salmon louse) hypothetical protein n=1 Tax=Lepeophtheirus salmonis TaxID=72036 RepID=A0A7R8CGF7_LEPSM|nr:unnamed protein product [Lepeophtheirus salmonis]CAF2815579.1 unnamed protein product [Lepeophtheirus salmonis]